MSGDTIIVRGPPKGGPPPERTIGLSNISAPKLARRPMGPSDGSPESKDEVRPQGNYIVAFILLLFTMICRSICYHNIMFIIILSIKRLFHFQVGALHHHLS